MKENFILGIGTIILSVFFLIINFTSPVRSSSIIGANSWANIILTFMLVLGVLQIIKTIRQLRDKSTDQDTEVFDNKEKRTLQSRNHWYILGALILYAFLLPYLGFIVVTTILVFFMAWILGMSKKSQILTTSVLSNAAFILIFAHLLNIPLPKGVGIFSVLSSLLY